MATVTLSVANISSTFPVGTVVKAIANKGVPTTDPQSGVPAGTELGSAAVGATGSWELAGGVEGTIYTLAAEVSGTWRYMHVRADSSGEVTPIATQATGDFAITTAGKGLKIKEEAGHAKLGSGTLAGGKVTVANTSVTAESRIFVTPKGAKGAHIGGLTVTAKVAATSFTVESSDAEDAREFDYFIVEPA